MTNCLHVIRQIIWEKPSVINALCTSADCLTNHDQLCQNRWSDQNICHQAMDQPCDEELFAWCFGWWADWSTEISPCLCRYPRSCLCTSFIKGLKWSYLSNSLLRLEWMGWNGLYEINKGPLKKRVDWSLQKEAPCTQVRMNKGDSKHFRTWCQMKQWIGEYWPLNLTAWGWDISSEPDCGSESIQSTWRCWLRLTQVRFSLSGNIPLQFS